MDVEMKNVDGNKPTRQIIAAYPKANVVMVTEYNEEELRKAA